MTAKSARKSPKTEMICAYQRRRSMDILEDRRHAERLGRRGGGGCGVEELRGFVFIFGGWGG